MAGYVRNRKIIYVIHNIYTYIETYILEQKQNQEILRNKQEDSR